jgi:hypothetical protein
MSAGKILEERHDLKGDESTSGEQQLHDAKPRVVSQFELNSNQTTKRA